MLLHKIIQKLSLSSIYAWVWTLLILIACSWPGKDLPQTNIVGFDKIVHIGLFFVWVIIWLIKSHPKYLTVLAIGSIFGLAIECYQQILPMDRTFDWWDALADAIGVLLGYLFLKLAIQPHLHRLY